MMVIVPLAASARTGGRMGGSNFSRYAPQVSSGWSRSSSRGVNFSSAPSVRVNSFLFPTYGFGFGYGGSSLFSLMLFAFVAYSLFSALQRARGDDADIDYQEEYTERASVSKVQVGLLGLARSLQTDLDSIARRSDTSSPSGLHFLLQGNVLLVVKNQSVDYRDALGIESESRLLCVRCG